MVHEHFIFRSHFLNICFMSITCTKNECQSGNYILERNLFSSLKHILCPFMRLSGEWQQIVDSQEDFHLLKSEDFSFLFFYSRC